MDKEEIWFFKTTHTVQNTNLDPYKRVFTVSAETGEGKQVVDVADHSLDIQFEPALSLVQSGPLVAVSGNTIVFSFLAYNNDNIGDGSAISQLSLTDSTGSTPILTDSTGSVVRLTKFYDNDDDILDVGERWLYITSYTVQASDTPRFENVGILSGLNRDGGIVEDTASHQVLIGQQSGLALHIDGPANANLNQTVFYTITLSNSQDNGAYSAIKNITLKANTNDEINFIASSDDKNDGFLEIDEVWTYTMSHKIILDDLDPFTLVLSAIGVDVSNNDVGNSKSYSLDVSYHPALAISVLQQASISTTNQIEAEVVNDPITGDGSPMSQVQVEDTTFGTLFMVTGDDNNNNLLESGEQWTFAQIYYVSILIELVQALLQLWIWITI